MDIKKPQLGKVEAFAFVFQREFCNTIRRSGIPLQKERGECEIPNSKFCTSIWNLHKSSGFKVPGY